MVGDRPYENPNKVAPIRNQPSILVRQGGALHV